MAKKNVAGIAKKSRGASKTKKKEETTPKVNQDDKSLEMTKDYKDKAKERIDELMRDIDLNPQERKKATEKITKEEMGGIEWLSEQVDKLSKTNERLLKENLDLKKVKQDTTKDNTKEYVELKNSVITFFNEFQTYYFKWGSKMVIEPEKFIQKMVKDFPFLKQYKK